MIPFVKIYHTNDSVVNFDLTPYLRSMQLAIGSEATKNSATIELINYQNALDGQGFTINDSNFTIYLDWQPITTQDPIMTATLTTIAMPTNNDGKSHYKLKVTDKTAMFLNKVWAFSYQADSLIEGQATNAPRIIKNVIGHLNNLDASTSDDLTTNNVATTKRDGSAFPTGISISKIWKPGYEWITELSQPEYTNEDRPYIFYVDANNDLHWQYPEQKPITELTSSVNTSTTTIPVNSTSGYPSFGFIAIEEEIIFYTSKTSTSFTNCTRGYKESDAATHAAGTQVSGLVLWPGRQDVYNLDVNSTEESTYNFIIYNAGPTPSGYDYLYYSLDPAQVGKKFRMKFVQWAGIAKDLTSRDMALTTFADGFPTAYPFTTSWGVIVSNDDDYQAEFILELQKRADAKARAYYVIGRQKFSGKVQMRGNTAYNINDTVTVYQPKYSRVDFMRVKDVKHQLNESSWITDLELEEDPGIINLE